MPIYEYECTTCQHKFDHMQKINDAPPICPHCAAETVTRLISPVGFQLKGNGWYVTDFKDQKKPSSTEKKESSPKASKEDKKT